VKPNRSPDAFYWQDASKEPRNGAVIGGPNMWTSFFRAIAQLFSPRPCDFGARLTAHYGLDA